jgi:hypothetical protein
MGLKKSFSAAFAGLRARCKGIRLLLLDVQSDPHPLTQLPFKLQTYRASPTPNPFDQNIITMFGKLFIALLATSFVAAAPVDNAVLEKRMTHSGRATYFATGQGACGWVSHQVLPIAE